MLSAYCCWRRHANYAWVSFYRSSVSIGDVATKSHDYWLTFRQSQLRSNRRTRLVALVRQVLECSVHLDLAGKKDSNLIRLTILLLYQGSVIAMTVPLFYQGSVITLTIMLYPDSVIIQWRCVGLLWRCWQSCCRTKAASSRWQCRCFTKAASSRWQSCCTQTTSSCNDGAWCYYGDVDNPVVVPRQRHRDDSVVVLLRQCHRVDNPVVVRWRARSVDSCTFPAVTPPVPVRLWLLQHSNETAQTCSKNFS